MCQTHFAKKIKNSSNKIILWYDYSLSNKLKTPLPLFFQSAAMSKISFKTFCIEFYAKHTGKTGPEVYAEFEKSGLLQELDEDYEDLHGMGMEALMQMFDNYLGKESAS